MTIHKLEQFYDIRKPVVTVGTFDGVHLGHKAILRRLKERALETQGESVVFTFYPHPRSLLFPNQKLGLLNTVNEKAQLLSVFGVGHLIVFPFTPEFSQMTSCEFIYQILFKTLKTSHLIVGHDHHFGRDRQGDTELLKKCTLSHGFDVERVGELREDGTIVSSTKIRQALEAGEVKLAAKMLGYPYRLSGRVVHGNKIGRRIGFPTANLELSSPEKVLPLSGVYAVNVLIHNRKHAGMLNIGTRPTIDNENKLSVEVHIFNFNENIYGQEVTLEFLEYIRAEKKFELIENLQSQLETDKLHITGLIFGN